MYVLLLLSVNNINLEAFLVTLSFSEYIRDHQGLKTLLGCTVELDLPPERGASQRLFSFFLNVFF